jgi:hypothetical protein
MTHNASNLNQRRKTMTTMTMMTMTTMTTKMMMMKAILPQTTQRRMAVQLERKGNPVVLELRLVTTSW